MYTMEDYLILVDEDDKPLGKLEKSNVHRLGLLHRAFSVFIFNTKGEMLLQQRADDKYHSGGLWANACCSHPRFGELTEDAVHRRLKEEMGLEFNPQFAFTFLYHAQLENGLIEHELDHVYIGVTDEQPVPNVTEVKSWKYISIDELSNDLLLNRNRYAIWFQTICAKAVEYFNNTFN
jgi:isopentenyl-diphosphate delta-isomerase